MSARKLEQIKSMGREGPSHDSQIILMPWEYSNPMAFLILRIKKLYLKEKKYGTGKSCTAGPRNTQKVV